MKGRQTKGVHYATLCRDGMASHLTDLYIEAIRAWGLSANAVSSIRRGLFFILKTEGPPPRTPRWWGKIIPAFFSFFLMLGLAIGR